MVIISRHNSTIRRQQTISAVEITSDFSLKLVSQLVPLKEEFDHTIITLFIRRGREREKEREREREGERKRGREKEREREWRGVSPKRDYC